MRRDALTLEVVSLPMVNVKEKKKFLVELLLIIIIFY